MYFIVPALLVNVLGMLGDVHMKYWVQDLICRQMVQDGGLAVVILILKAQTIMLQK